MPAPIEPETHRSEEDETLRVGQIPAESPADAHVREGRETHGLYPALLLGIVVFVLIMPWHAVNKRLPIWDAAEFVLVSQKIVDRFDDGLVAGLQAFYSERGWRPIIFPSICAPVFMLAGGRILLAVGLMQFLTVLLLAGYIYAFLRDTLSPPRALVGAILVVSTRWIVDFSNVFYADLLFLSATAAVLYHLARAYRRSAPIQFILSGAWLALMVALRPVETATLAIIPAIALVVHGWRRREIRGVDLSLFLAQLFAVALAVWLLAKPGRHWVAVLGLLALSAAIIAVGARRSFPRTSILGCLVLAEALALAWHFPTIRPLYLWAYECSFGSLAQLVDQKFHGLSPWLVLWELLQRFSPKMLCVLLAVALVGAMRTHRPGPSGRCWLVIAISILMAAPMLVLLSVSGTSDMRRLMPPMLLVNLGLVMVAMAPGGTLPRIRALALAAVMAAQVVNGVTNGLNIRTPILLEAQRITGYLRPPHTGEDPHSPVLDGILGLGIREGRIAAYSYFYRDYATADRLGLPMFEPMALSAQARERHIPIEVHFTCSLNFASPETLAAQIKAEHFDYVLVDMFDSPANVNRRDPYVQHTESFISLIRSGLPEGLVERGCFSTLKRPLCLIEADPPRDRGSAR